MRKSLAAIMFILPLIINCDPPGQNPGPTSYNQTVSVDEDSSISITVLASHPWNSALKWEVVIFPSHGSLAGTLPHCTYTPDPDYNGGDSYSFRTSDGYKYSNIAKVDITVNPVNDPPTSTSASITTFEDANVGVTPTVIDVDNGDSYTFSILTLPSSGTVSILANQLFFAPIPNMNGTDSFTYRVFDSGSEQVDGTASVTVIPVNDPPSSTSASITTVKNATSAGVTPTVIDVDAGESFTFSILTQPLSGSAYVLSNQLYYEPNPDISGSDSFAYRAYDSGSEHVDGIASVTIGAVNSSPSANSQSVITDEDVGLPIVLTASDPDGNELTWAIISQPSNGAVSGTPPNVSYLSALNYNGSDSFTFKVNDGSTDSNIATVTININPVNDPPTFTSASITTDEDTASGGVTPVVLDVDTLDSYTFSILTRPAEGTASIIANQLVYDPGPDYNGSDSFTFRARDSGGESVDGTAAVTVNPVNDPPSSTSASITTDEDTPSGGVTPTVIDVDTGESFTFSILTQPLAGSAYVLSNQLYYEPNPDISGSDSFTYRAFDSGAEQVDGRATVTIVGVNDPPIADTQAVIADEDVSLPIVLTASDPDGDELTWTIVSQPSNGAVSGTPPNVTYLSALNYNGSDSFTFKVSDGSVDSIAATVSLTVNPMPDIWFVDIDATGISDGSSWTNAFNHPQDALDTAGAGDEVWVAEGTYVKRAGPDGYVVTMIDGVDLYGGFSGVETTSSQRDLSAYFTTLDGEDTAGVVYGANNARLDGFTVTRAWGNGILNTGVSPTIANCIFENNGLAGGLDGGAIQNVSEANAYISSSTFTNNYRSAIYNENSSPTVYNCNFNANLSDEGGAIKNQGESTAPYISNSLFDRNSSTANGGAISNVASIPLIENCIFSGNIAGQNGGAIANSGGANANVTNSLFTGNTATLSGGAIFNSDSKPTLINCTIAHNYAESFGGGVVNENRKGIDPIIINSILWNNSDVQISGKVKVTYSNIQEEIKGKGNIDQDPSFMDTTTSDYHLKSDSPCIDTGDNTPVTTALDLGGNPRISDGNGDGSVIVDMGVYEYLP